MGSSLFVSMFSNMQSNFSRALVQHIQQLFLRSLNYPWWDATHLSQDEIHNAPILIRDVSSQDIPIPMQDYCPHILIGVYFQ